VASDSVVLTGSQQLELSVSPSRGLCLLDMFSVMLAVQGDQRSIGYKTVHARVRQRFTIRTKSPIYLLHARKSGKA